MTDQNTRLYRHFWRWHFFAAALVIPFVLWQSVTGTLYLWSEWWMDVRHADVRFVSSQTNQAPYAAQVAAALVAAPDGRIEELIIPADRTRSTTVILAGANGLPYPVFVDPGTARVLGTLETGAWLPGLSRGLHAGWPAGKIGAWLLELGNCWAIVMLLTGLYLWWPRDRSLWRALWPRFGAGTRILIRDLHACIGVWFSGIFLFFLISALPWTSVWGREILPVIEKALGQKSEVSFMPGGVTADRLEGALPSLDAVIAQARANGVTGDFVVRLAPWPGGPWWLTNRSNAPGTDRYQLTDPESAAPLADLGSADLPAIPRLVALGIHVHQGDLGPVNVWLNTAFATSLVWMSITGFLSWWHRRPRRKLAAPPPVAGAWSRNLIALCAGLGLLLPLFGLSVLALLGGDLLVRRFARAFAALRV